MSASKWSGCTLDKRQCVSLHSILRGFDAPLKEEHVWAIAHQTLKTLASLIEQKNGTFTLALANEAAHVLLHKEGFVHRDTFVVEDSRARAGGPRMALNNEDKAVSGVGLALFSALDFGMSQVEQRTLSKDIEALLEHMTALDEQEVEDEGIEDDEANVEPIRLTGAVDHFLLACGERGSSSHFRNVCRALVSESLELSSFMERVTHLDEEREELRHLDLQDWARLWVQCVKDLRMGVKLKKIERCRHEPIEYELTPYEMLMDDIRARRYKLNKVETVVRDSGVAKDAHDVILDFIRSRPPLRPVGERKLKPLRKESTPVELLMQSIRGSEARSSLRKTSAQPRKVYKSESSRTTLEPTASTRHRRVVEPRSVDVASMLNFEDNNSDNDEDDNDEFFDAEDFYDDAVIDAVTDEHESCDQGIQEERKLSHMRRVTKDLALHTSPSSSSSSSTHRRRHSLSVCETPPQSAEDNINNTKKVLEIDLDDLDENNENKFVNKGTSKNFGKESKNKGPAFKSCFESIAEETSEQLSVFSDAADTLNELLRAIYGSRLIDNEDDRNDFFRSDQTISKETWSLALKTLSLTLDEVIHIRSVLTKAELESLPIDSNIKQGLSSGKICFLCMKSRFSLFRWGLRCQLCHQQVCKKCATKMRIPVQHFSSTPASALSARTTASTAAELSHLRHKSDADVLDAILAATSAPSSPDLSIVDNNFASLNNVDNMEDLLGSSLRICLDCKKLVLQVIRAQSSLALINRQDIIWTKA